MSKNELGSNFFKLNITAYIKKFLITSFFCSFSLLVAQDVIWDSSPVQISNPGQNASQAQIGIDQEGNAIAAWLEGGDVKSSTLLLNGTWTSPFSVAGSSTASSPLLVVDSAGNATLIWLDSTVVFTATLPPIQPSVAPIWSSPISISSTGASSPRLNVDPTTGNLAAAWLVSSKVQASTKLFNQAWTSPVQISNSSFVATSPYIGIGQNDQVVVVWTQPYSLGNFTKTVYSATQSINPVTAWSSPVAITDGTYNTNNPKVAVDISGNSVAAWFRYDVQGAAYSNVMVEAATQPIGGNWTTPTQLSLPGLMNPSNLFLRVRNDMNQNAIVAWSESYDGSTLNCGMGIKLANQPWRPTLGLIGQNLYAYSLDLGATQEGQVFAIYMAQDPSTSDLGIFVRKTDIYSYSSGWNSVLTPLSQGTNNSSPKVVCTNVGDVTHAAAVWLQFNGVNTVVQAIVGEGTLYPLPQNLNVSQASNNFGVFTEYYNTLSWDPSVNANTTHYLVLRNGVVIGIVPASSTTMTFIDHNQVQHGFGTVTYGIAAIDESNSQSAVVSITY